MNSKIEEEDPDLISESSEGEVSYIAQKRRKSSAVEVSSGSCWWWLRKYKPVDVSKFYK